MTVYLYRPSTDIDDSDSDSESIVLENRLVEQNVYAEVLYSFKAVGVEELNLERGALVEVLRIESGPWWWGRVKHDAILSNHNAEQSQGWFPKDYIKVCCYFAVFFTLLSFSFIQPLCEF